MVVEPNLLSQLDGGHVALHLTRSTKLKPAPLFTLLFLASGCVDFVYTFVIAIRSSAIFCLCTLRGGDIYVRTSSDSRHIRILKQWFLFVPYKHIGYE